MSLPLQLSPKLESLPADEPQPQPQPPDGAWRPKVQATVEPAISARQWDEFPRGLVLDVDFSLRADGTVAAVSFVSLAPRALLRVVQEALERWRFEALPAARVHRVQLVLNPPPR